MTKQAVDLTVLPENATYKELTCTLSDKSLATLVPTDTGVELEALKSGTGTLKVESKHKEVVKTIPVNVGETTKLPISNKGGGSGSRYIKDLGTYPNLAPNIPFYAKDVTLGTGDVTMSFGSYPSDLTYLWDSFYSAKAVTVSADIQLRK